MGAAESLGVDIRAGPPTGEVQADGEKVGGLAVHIGAQVTSQAKAGAVLAFGTTKDLVMDEDGASIR